MSASFYKLTCLTNLHMGNGDVNYNVIDLEVERDPVLLEPTMNASGVKGALRDYFKKEAKDPKDIVYIFGSEGSGEHQGQYQFLSGDLIARPVRVSKGSSSYVLATTRELVEHLRRKLSAFGLGGLYTGDLPVLHENEVLTGADCAEIEGITARKVDSPLLEKLIGDNWALMTQEQLKAIELPVLAHNVLENGISKNLWYEQIVPHQSIFGAIIIAPGDDKRFEQVIGSEGKVVQFGAGATTGNGFTLMRKEG